MTSKNANHRLRRICRGFRDAILPQQSREHLRALRLRELDIVSSALPLGGKVLEIGAGSGWQAHELARRGCTVSAIDVPQSDFANERVWPVIEYDGRNIPFDAATFDVVFSSNVLEHIPGVRVFQAEIRRVLRNDGVAVHVVPSASWRFWTNFTHPVRFGALPVRHGEHAANAFSEILAFRRSSWYALFTETGWEVERSTPTGLFYTGCSVADHHLSIRNREFLAQILGSACTLFILRKAV